MQLSNRNFLDQENDMKIVKSLEESSLLTKVKEQRRRFLGMLLGKVGASLLGTLLTSKEIMRAG